MKDIVDILRANSECHAPHLMLQAADEIELLRIGVAIALKERDEARRMYCRQTADSLENYREPERIADDREWDCFSKENVK